MKVDADGFGDGGKGVGVVAGHWPRGAPAGRVATGTLTKAERHGSSKQQRWVVRRETETPLGLASQTETDSEDLGKRGKEGTRTWGWQAQSEGIERVKAERGEEGLGTTGA